MNKESKLDKVTQSYLNLMASLNLSWLLCAKHENLDLLKAIMRMWNNHSTKNFRLIRIRTKVDKNQEKSKSTC